MGNITVAQVNRAETRSDSYNPANQMNAATYDAAGNLTGYGSGAIYEYDALHRLVRNTNAATSYHYNGDGVLMAAATGGITTTYTQDLAVALPQILTDGTTTHIYGLDRLASVDGSGTRTWEIHDALGSVRQHLAADGSVLPGGSYAYTPFGVVASGNTPAPFGFTGELHSEGLVYLRARWYDPSVGTFTSRDPFAGINTVPNTLHPYMYAADNPVLYTDPSGKCYDELGFLRDIEPGACTNLDKALYLAHAPDPNISQSDRLWARAYMNTWAIGHAYLFVGGGVLVVAGGGKLFGVSTATTTTGMFAGGGFDLGIQLATNDFNIHEINALQLYLNTMAGGIGSIVGGVVPAKWLLWQKMAANGFGSSATAGIFAGIYNYFACEDVDIVSAMTYGGVLGGLGAWAGGLPKALTQGAHKHAIAAHMQNITHNKWLVSAIKNLRTPPGLITLGDNLMKGSRPNRIQQYLAGINAPISPPKPGALATAVSSSVGTSIANATPPVQVLIPHLFSPAQEEVP